jgi:hypothetical protein
MDIRYIGRALLQQTEHLTAARRQLCVRILGLVLFLACGKKTVTWRAVQARFTCDISGSITSLSAKGCNAAGTECKRKIGWLLTQAIPGGCQIQLLQTNSVSLPTRRCGYSIHLRPIPLPSFGSFSARPQC